MATENEQLPPASPRLSFRRWHESDAAAVLEMYSRPEVYRFLGARPSPVRTLNEALAWIAARNARTTGLGGIWAIDATDDRELADDGPIGSVLLVPLTRTDGAATQILEIGWHLHPRAWGHGYATEAARAMITRARHGGLSEVRAVVHPGNSASLAVCQGLGMTEVGLTAEWYGIEVVEYRLDLSPKVSVAPLRGDEWRVLRVLRLAALTDSPEAFVPDVGPERAGGEVEWRRRIAADDWLVARVGGAPAGLLAVSVPDARHAADGWIHSWWIEPEARGRGMSRVMLDGAFSMGRARGWSRMGLGVWVENTQAIAAFTAMGFVGEDPRPSSRFRGRHYVAMFRDFA